MNRKHLLPALILLASALPLHAASADDTASATLLDYDFIELGAQKIDASDIEANADSYTVRASTALGQSFFLGLTATALQLNDYSLKLDSQAYSLLLGYHHPLSRTVDVVLAAGPTHLRVQGNGGEANATGGQAQLGLRVAATPNLELSATVAHQRIEGIATTSYSASARYLFTRNFSVGLNLGGGDDLSNYGASVRWQF